MRPIGLDSGALEYLSDYLRGRKYNAKLDIRCALTHEVIITGKSAYLRNILLYNLLAKLVRDRELMAANLFNQYLLQMSVFELSHLLLADFTTLPTEIRLLDNLVLFRKIWCQNMKDYFKISLFLNEFRIIYWNIKTKEGVANSKIWRQNM